MTMREALTWMPAWAAGGGLGALFYGGLWWTIRRGVSSPRPAPWFLGSLLLRMSLTVAGFHLVSGGRWERLLWCLLGFVMARVAVTRLTRPSTARQTRTARGP